MKGAVAPDIKQIGYFPKNFGNFFIYHYALILAIFMLKFNQHGKKA
jgi:hypothetical protein